MSAHGSPNGPTPIGGLIGTLRGGGILRVAVPVADAEQASAALTALGESDEGGIFLLVSTPTEQILVHGDHLLRLEVVHDLGGPEEKTGAHDPQAAVSYCTTEGAAWQTLPTDPAALESPAALLRELTQRDPPGFVRLTGAAGAWTLLRTGDLAAMRIARAALRPPDAEIERHTGDTRT